MAFPTTTDFVFLVFTLLSFFAHSDGIGRTQSSGVEGYLTCEGEPAKGVKVIVKL